MTIYELYDSAIKTLPVNERPRLARLILDDAAPDAPYETEATQAYLAGLIKEGLDSGPATPWTSNDVYRIMQSVIARSFL
jgi:hypothetical protein